MKKYFVVLLLLSLAVAAVPSGGVELQQGWYAKYQYVKVHGAQWAGDHLVEWTDGWYPSSSLGQFGPLLVEDVSPAFRGRKITVTENTSMPAGILFEDHGSFTANAAYYQDVYVEWFTDYDPARLRLQMIRHRTGAPDDLVWDQPTSGPAMAGGYIPVVPVILPGDTISFRLTVVPEPSGLLALVILSSTGGTAVLIGRRAR